MSVFGTGFPQLSNDPFLGCGLCCMIQNGCYGSSSYFHIPVSKNWKREEVGQVTYLVHFQEVEHSISNVLLVRTNMAILAAKISGKWSISGEATCPVSIQRFYYKDKLENGYVVLLGFSSYIRNAGKNILNAYLVAKRRGNTKMYERSSYYMSESTLLALPVM